MHFYGWKAGLKTGCYYLRTKTPVTAQKFTVDPRLLASIAGGTSVAESAEGDDDAFSRSSEDEEDEEAAAAAAAEAAAVDKKELKRALMEKLAAEYEKSVAEAKEEGCTMCGS
jgi:hypothetical protein